MKRFVPSCLLALSFAATAQLAADDVVIQPIAQQRAPRQAAVNPNLLPIVCKRLWTDGETVQVELSVPTGKQRTEVYQVQVPIVQNGRTIIKTEQRTRLIPETKQKRVDASEVFLFYDLDGKKIAPQELAKRIPKDGLVGVLSRTTPNIPVIWKEVLKPDTVIVGRQPPKP